MHNLGQDLQARRVNKKETNKKIIHKGKNK